MNECPCTRPTRDGAYLCDLCGDELAAALNDMPWMDGQLDDAVTGVKGIDYRRLGNTTTGKPTEMPSPVNWRAADVRRNLHQMLTEWVRRCDVNRIRNSSPYPGLPVSTVPELARWLTWRVDGLQVHELGPAAHQDVTAALAACYRVIDRRPERQYLGACDVCEDGGRLYATAGARWARCDRCDAAEDAGDLRARLLAELDDRLCTAAEIAHLSTFLGLRADREAVRKRINVWASRGKVARHTVVTGEGMFRFGEVYALLVEAE